MSPRVTLVAPPPPSGRGGGSVREIFRADVLSEALAAALKVEVVVMETPLADATGEGVILLLDAALESQASVIAPEVANRVFWLHGSIKTTPRVLERHRLAGSVHLLNVLNRTKGGHAEAPVCARREIAAKIAVAQCTVPWSPDYVLLNHDRRLDLVTVLGACCAVVLGHAPPA